MAMIYKARELIGPGGASTGRWHFTAGSDEDLGYCYPVCGCERGSAGHETPEQAEEHYQETESQIVRLGRDETTKKRCQSPGCDEWTNGTAMVGSPSGFVETFRLCNEHYSEGVATLLYLAKARS